MAAIAAMRFVGPPTGQAVTSTRRKKHNRELLRDILLQVCVQLQRFGAKARTMGQKRGRSGSIIISSSNSNSNSEDEKGRGRGWREDGGGYMKSAHSFSAAASERIVAAGVSALCRITPFSSLSLQGFYELCAAGPLTWYSGTSEIFEWVTDDLDSYRNDPALVQDIADTWPENLPIQRSCLNPKP